MSQKRVSYDPEGTCEIETVVLLDLLAWVGVYRPTEEGIRNMGAEEIFRLRELRRRVLAGRVYVGVCDWPVEEASNG